MLLSGPLARHSLFQNIGQEALNTLSADLALVEYRKGGIVTAGQSDNSEILFVLSGELTSIMTSKEGREVAIEVFGVGAVIGEIETPTGDRRDALLRAERQCLIGRVSVDAFRNWVEKHPVIAQNLISLMSKRISHNTRRIFDLVVHDVDTRVRLLIVALAHEADLLIDGGEITDAPSHTRIAALVGANREAVSRVMSRLNREDTLRSGRRRIRIKSVEALTAGL